MLGVVGGVPGDRAPIPIAMVRLHRPVKVRVTCNWDQRLTISDGQCVQVADPILGQRLESGKS
jgi:hypothetical protein